MKRILFALFVVVFVNSLCFAQQPKAPVAETASKPVVIASFTGKVESILLGNTAKRILSKIVVADEKGKKLSFIVENTLYFDKNDKATTLNKINKNTKVIVEYTTNQAGAHIAKTIKVLK